MRASQMVKIERLQQMRSAGAISDEEFEAEKDKVLTSTDWFPWAIGGIALVTALVALFLWLGLPGLSVSTGQKEGGNTAAEINETDAMANVQAASTEEAAEETGPQFITREYKPDAKLASLTYIASALKASALDFLKPDPDTDCTRDSGCSQSVIDEVEFSSPVLVSVRRISDQFLGGAHGSASAADFNFFNGKQVQFGQLFTSWAEAKPIIQQAFCAQLLRSQPSEVTGGDGYECPNVDDTALTFSGSRNISSVSVATSDYQLGYYAAGRTQETVPLTPELVALLRPEIAELVSVP